MATKIHATAVVEPGAELGVDCEIMPYAMVSKHCVLGDNVVVHPFAVLGGDPQYLQFDRELSTGLRIGSGSVIREHVTVNRSIHEGESTLIGEKCFLMATSHVGHDCVVGDQAVLANAALLAGHVSVGAHTFMGGSSAVHQFCRIGESVMVAGLAAITRDVPPYVMVAERDDVIALNTVGLRRRGFSREVMKELKSAYQAIFFTTGNIRKVAGELLSASAEVKIPGASSGAFDKPTANSIEPLALHPQSRSANQAEASFGVSDPLRMNKEARQFLEFFTGGTRGFARARHKRESGVSDGH